jgi:D-Tyr-tRNAtyr deacylase
MEETLDGKRAIFRSLREFQFTLTQRVEQGKRCGFHISESEAIDIPLYMMYNKLFENSWRVKIDSM